LIIQSAGVQKRSFFGQIRPESPSSPKLFSAQTGMPQALSRGGAASEVPCFDVVGRLFVPRQVKLAFFTKIYIENSFY
jgi:hypothetical protein